MSGKLVISVPNILAIMVWLAFLSISAAQTGIVLGASEKQVLAGVEKIKKIDATLKIQRTDSTIHILGRHFEESVTLRNGRVSRTFLDMPDLETDEGTTLESLLRGRKWITKTIEGTRYYSFQSVDRRGRKTLWILSSGFSEVWKERRVFLQTQYYGD